jgi:DNA-binding protein H-NS
LRVLAFQTDQAPNQGILYWEAGMAKQNLAAMTIDALLKLRNDIGAVLSKKADELKSQLSALGEDAVEIGRMARRGRKKAKTAKVAPKYRDAKTGLTWAGRGAQPVWLREAVKEGKKPEDFLIEKPAKTAAKPRRKKK